MIFLLDGGNNMIIHDAEFQEDFFNMVDDLNEKITGFPMRFTVAKKIIIGKQKI